MPSIPGIPPIPSLAGSGLERGEQFWAQIVAALKGAKESRKRKKLKPTFRTCKRTPKRLRKGTSKKRLKELNKMYRYQGVNALNLFQASAVRVFSFLACLCTLQNIRLSLEFLCCLESRIVSL